MEDGITFCEKSFEMREIAYLGEVAIILLQVMSYTHWLTERSMDMNDFCGKVNL